MIRITRYKSAARILIVFVGTGALLTPFVHAAPPSSAMSAADTSITVPEAWARASAGNATTGAAYITLKGGTQPDQLIAASTPIAATAEVHETISDNGIMKMRPVQAVLVLADQSITFKPGGTHIMLMGLKQKMMAGQSFPLTLTFTHAAPITVDVIIRGLGHDAGMDGHNQMHMQ